MTTKVPDFPALERVASRVAEHPFFPGKAAVVRECLADVDERFRRGELSEAQRSRLVAILRPD
jgi:hypothetical protein